MPRVGTVVRNDILLEDERPDGFDGEVPVRFARLRGLPGPGRRIDELDALGRQVAQVRPTPLEPAQLDPPHATSAASSALAARCTSARIGGSTSKRFSSIIMRSSQGVPRRMSFLPPPFP